MITPLELKRRLAKPRPGRAILFTGAGFSQAATNSLDCPVPLAKHFAEALAKEIGEPPDLPLTLISEIYAEKKNDPDAFLNLLKATFTIKEAPEHQNTILRYPWKRIYTTNYDDLAEHLSAPDGTRADSYTRDTIPLQLEGDYRQIVHINGYVGAIDRNTAIDDFALTLSSYFDKNLFSSRWATTIRQDFELADLIVFIGYSLYDTDIMNLLGRNPQLHDKTVAIQWSGLSSSEERFLTRFGTVLKIGNDGFASIIDEILQTGPPAVAISGPENFVEIRLPHNPPALPVTDNNINALLGRGIFDRELLFSSLINGGRPYVVSRSSVSQICQGLHTSGAQVVVHSEIGNGKSLIIEQAVFSLLRENKRVFLFDRKTDEFNYDIEYLSHIREPYVLVIEEMLANEDIIETVNSQLSGARVLLTCRSSAFEVKSSEIRHLFPSETKVIDVNKLSFEDTDKVIAMLNTGAYWFNFPNTRTTIQKRRIIERNCRSELGSVMLGVVESQVLDERIRGLFQTPQTRNLVAQRAMILALCLNYVEMRPTFELLSELLGCDIFTVMSTIKNEYVGQFFAISGIEVVARSPIMSGYILKNFVADSELVNVIITALQASSDRYRRAKRYREINSKFLQFSVIERLITSANNKHEWIQEFYDRAGNIGYREFSPHYWLQYAIASRAFKDYRAAERFFSESKKLAARRPDFYTYKIDNSYAQFLLESRMEVDIWADFPEAFFEASTLAFQQTSIKKTGLYPYKVAARFLDFVEVRGERFTVRQKEQARDFCKGWLDRIDGLSMGVRRNPIVREARTSVSGAFDLLDGA